MARRGLREPAAHVPPLRPAGVRTENRRHLRRREREPARYAIEDACMAVVVHGADITLASRCHCNNSAALLGSGGYGLDFSGGSSR